MNNTKYLLLNSVTYLILVICFTQPQFEKKIHLNVRKFETNCLATSCFTAYFCVPFGKFYAWLNRFTHPAGVMVVTNIRDVEEMKYLKRVLVSAGVIMFSLSS